MKKILLSAGLLTISLFSNYANANSQVDSVIVSSVQRKNVITFSPFSVFSKVKIKYERPLHPNFSVGVALAGFYAAFPGYRVEPFARLYFGAEAPDGLYLQGQGAVYHHKALLDLAIVYNKDGVETPAEKRSFTRGGAGVGLGYQWLSGSSDRVVVDIMGGFKYYSIPDFKTSDDSPNPGKGLSNGVWYTTGPGSKFNGTIAVGFIF